MTPKTPQDLINTQPEVRVIDSEHKEYLKEYKAYAINYRLETVVLADDHTEQEYYAGFSQIQCLTPASYKDYRVGLGDEVKVNDEWWTVVSYYWGAYSKQWMLIGYQNDLTRTIVIIANGIQDIRPLHKGQEKCDSCENCSPTLCKARRCKCCGEKL